MVDDVVISAHEHVRAGCGPPGVVVPGGRVVCLCGELVDAADGSSFGVSVRGWDEFDDSVDDAYFPVAMMDQSMAGITQEHAIFQAGIATIGPVRDVMAAAPAGWSTAFGAAFVSRYECFS
ncbi:hypothetical protein GCM10009765_20570 [Fodinicola feengrottensis]|uniref:Uncharacterized protein n=1 Tax=Fodinicola feengrottensis TaxID=435914 RepID=A0ABN2GHM6_9ACTN|nr:hypothetical protein [Fodinicola feengrottensis]